MTPKPGASRMLLRWPGLLHPCDGETGVPGMGNVQGVPRCAACGDDAPWGAVFCPGCGTPLDPAPAAEVRRPVTILFADVVQSTALGESVDPETLRRVMGLYFDAARAAVGRHGGSLEKFIGDAVLAVFGAPRTREDDALRAVRAALDLIAGVGGIGQQIAAETTRNIRVRVGVNTGEVVVGATRAGGAFVTGDAVNVAARLEQAAAPGEVLLGAPTYRLVRDMVEATSVRPLRVKGLTEPLEAWRLTSVLDRRRDGRRRGPFVGRAAELQTLHHAFGEAARDRRCVVVTLVGAPGEGKTRLGQEFLSQIGDSATALHGHCLSYGEGATYWPLREAVLEAVRLRGDESRDLARERLTRFLGGVRDAPAVALRLSHIAGFEGRARAPEDLAWAMRVLLETAASRRPLVLVIDDLHWAEPGLLDTLEHVADRSDSAAPILILLLSRPELPVDDPWLSARVLALSPLDDDSVERLLADLRLPPGVLDQLRRTAGGNPLFAEQLVAMLQDEAMLADRDGQLTWVGRSHELPPMMPATVSTLLAARLELLAEPERSTLERAAVVGATFYRAALEALAGSGAATVDSLVEALTRKGLVRPAESDLPTVGAAHAFVHALVRDAAYAGMTKALRADLHEQVAAWLEGADTTQIPEEVIGRHLELACRYREELLLPGQRTRSLAVRAADRLASGARRLERSDGSTAAALLGRAADLLSPRSGQRHTILLDLARQLLELGRFNEVLTAVSEVMSSDNDALAARGRLLHSELLSITDPAYKLEFAQQAVTDALPVLEESGDHLGLSDAYFLQHVLDGTLLRYARSGRMLDAAIAHAVLGRDEARAGRARAYRFTVPLFGPEPAEQAINTLDDLAQEFPTDLRLRAWVEQGTCILHAMCGRVADARRVAEMARTDLEAVGQVVFLANLAQSTGRVEELAGDTAAAAREYARSRAALRALGEAAYLSTVAGLHARLLAREGEVDGAQQALVEAGAATTTEDLMTQALIAESEAIILARRGDLDAAARAAARAVALTADGEAPDDLAEAHAVAATVWAWRGDDQTALTHLHLALAAFAAKGNVVRATAMRRGLDAVQTRSGPRREPF